jgi:hypothetical protein
MNLEQLQNSPHILFECVAGSRAYGLNHAQSDTDIKGVFISPIHEFYGFSYVDHINNDTSDISYFEIGKFIHLLCKSNPSVLELLFSPEDCIRKNSNCFKEIKPERFLSKQCFTSFARYAFTQIKKAKGLNKKITNQFDKERKTILDFCYVFQNQGSIPIQDWLSIHNYTLDRCGLNRMPHSENTYSLYYDSSYDYCCGFNGIIKKDNSCDVNISAISPGLKPLTYLYFNNNAYSKYCKEYVEYWDWVAKRNDARYNQTLEHGKNYDSKNMMHTFRLLAIAEEIASKKTIIVRRPDRDELLKIKSGYYEYEDLIAMASEKLIKIELAFNKSDLPEFPDHKYAEELLIGIRTRKYS